jgi:5-methylcytosine-specific restriction enzyme A
MSRSPSAGRRNPTWVRDEIILALDLYLRRKKIPEASDADVIELSATLNRLPLHTSRPDLERFRNPNGVVLKVANIAAIDPSYPGKGLTAGGRNDRLVWDELGSRPDVVRRLAAAIQALAGSAGSIALPEPDEGEVEASEGRLLYRMHRSRERSGRLVDRLKARAVAAGELHCTICAFDFARTYGPLGEGFIEAHHVVPLAAAGQTTNRVADLILVCSNCHSMLHRRRRWATPDELRAILARHRLNRDRR